MSKKIHLLLDDRAEQTVDRLGTATGKTIAGVFKDALSIYLWAFEEHLNGREIASIAEGTPTRTLKVPFNTKQG